VLLDWQHLAWPFLDEDTDVLSAVVQRAKSGGVNTVMVAGEVIYRDGRFTRVDRDAVLAELAAQLGQPRSAEEEGRRETARRVLPHLREFYRGWIED
jgi:cytosine/adenosine deaminase-related metal-dependent hydrolase